MNDDIEQAREAWQGFKAALWSERWHFALAFGFIELGLTAFALLWWLSTK